MNVERMKEFIVAAEGELFDEGFDMSMPQNCIGGMMLRFDGKVFGEIYNHKIALLDTAADWFGLTEDQSFELFYGYGEVWSGLGGGVMSLHGVEGGKVAIKALKKALELWS